VKIAIVNASSLYANADCEIAVVAVRQQLVEDVAPAWNRRAPDVQKFDKLEDVPTDWCILAILDSADEAGALGYHAETGDGRPYGRVFVKVTLQDGGTVSSVLSHEACEMFGDRVCNRWAQAPDGRMWALELCDAVQGDSYMKNGVEVSNFVTQAFFDDTPAPGAKLDFLGKLSAPFTLSPGGYSVVMAGGRVHQIQADGRALGFHELAEHKQHGAARTAKRFG
jgi:hypothetical protein